MSKLLRSELKDIVKECLIEILAEGINNNQPVRNKTKSKITETKNKSSYLDKVSFGNSKKEKTENKKPVQFKTNITADPILNELLADTAKSTLQEQMTADRRGNKHYVPNDKASQIVDKTNPEDLFGHAAASKWSQLAFFGEE